MLSRSQVCWATDIARVALITAYRPAARRGISCRLTSRSWRIETVIRHAGRRQGRRLLSLGLRAWCGDSQPAPEVGQHGKDPKLRQRHGPVKDIQAPQRDAGQDPGRGLQGLEGLRRQVRPVSHRPGG